MKTALFAQLCVSLLSALVLTEAHGDTEVVLVQIVFRHGDRTPVTIFPGDLYGESQWQKYGGLGQLTQKGMQQHYEYGEYLRERYKSFLSEEYHRDRVSVKSTTYDRTMMSVESMLAGLYKPIDFQVWNPELLWQPIPVMTANLDSLFMPKCPRYDELFNEVVNSDEFNEANAKFQNLIDEATKETGMKDLSLKNLWQIADTVFIEKSNNLTLPNWVVNNYDQLLKCRDIDFFFKYRTLEMAKLSSGGILNQMVKNIEEVTKKNSSLQLALFSAHDTYVASLMKLLGIAEVTKAPPYASSVTIELKKSKNSPHYYVLAYLKNNTDLSPNSFLLPITGCGSMCPLEDFMRIVESRIVDNPNKACMRHGPQIPPLNLLKNVTFMVSIGLSLLCLSLVSICAVRTFRRVFRQRSGYRQQEL